MLAMKTPRGGSRHSRSLACVRGALAATVAIAMSSGIAYGQEEPPYDPAVDVQLFDYAIGPKSFMTVTDGQVESAKKFSLDFLVTFFTNPLTVYNFDENDEEVLDARTNVVESVFSGQLVGAYGITDKIQVGASLPVVFSMSGEGLNPVDAMPSAGGFQATGIGDLLVEGKYKAWERDALSVAATAGVTIPSSVGSEGGDFLGDNLPTGRVRGAVQWKAPNGKLTAGANLGVLLRKPRTIYATEVGQQLTYAAGAAVKGTERLWLIGEIFGRAALPELDLDTSPLEAVGGARLKVGKALSVLAGGGAGLSQGVGAPGFRLFAAVGYAPDFRDSDGDGIANDKDNCPLVPEDKDGFEDRDGCPDDDNDGDRRPDSMDKCPDQAEDLDGFEDDDGCPESDNDKDGIDDFDDRCPTEAEDGKKPFDKDGCPSDKRDTDVDGIMDNVDRCVEDPEDEDGFEDWDGCPEEDNDKDGIPDEADQCPLCMEDKDGFEDEDGCPELDNDKDGVVDANDKCPAEAEVINGVDDADGCPDSGGQQVAELAGNVMRLSVGINFDRRDRLRSTSEIDQVAAIMNMHPEVARWRIVAVAKKQRSDEQTRTKSQAQADAIKAHLISRGIDSEKLEAVGAVSDRPTVAIAVLERVEADADEGMQATCPANLRAVERPAPEGGLQPTAMPKEAGPADRDSDGLLDDADSCPLESGPVENRGCPDTDRDGDGVVDRADNCPDEAGTADNQGCIKKQLVVITQDQIKILDVVHFATGKARIRSKSYPLLDNVAEVINAHPEIGMIRIEGHTDNVGNDERNRKLSQSRADAVRDYLVKKGVAAERLDSFGFGEEKPIADNTSNDGRSANRRVEFNIVNR